MAILFAALRSCNLGMGWPELSSHPIPNNLRRKLETVDCGFELVLDGAGKRRAPDDQPAHDGSSNQNNAHVLNSTLAGLATFGDAAVCAGDESGDGQLGLECLNAKCVEHVSPCNNCLWFETPTNMMCFLDYVVNATEPAGPVTRTCGPMLGLSLIWDRGPMPQPKCNGLGPGRNLEFAENSVDVILYGLFA